MLSWIEWVIVVAILGVIVAATGETFVLQIPLRLAFGWFGFAEANLHAMQPNIALIIEAIVCTTLLGVGGHYFSRWLWVHLRPVGTGEWQARWTVAGLAAILLLFVAGIASIGITHQTAWLFTMKGPMTIDSWGPRFILPEVFDSALPARKAVQAYFTRTGGFPASAKEAGVEEADLRTSKHVKAMRIEDKGVVVIELQHPAAPDGVIWLTPIPRGKDLEWKCTTTLHRAHAPPACRG